MVLLFSCLTFSALRAENVKQENRSTALPKAKRLRRVTRVK